MSGTDWLVRSCSSVLFENKIYISCASWNGLISIDTKTMDTRFIDSFPDVDFKTIWQHYPASIIGSEAVFFPRFSSVTHVYNPKDNKITPINLKGNRLPYMNNTIMNGNEILAFPVFTDEPFFIYDHEKRELKGIYGFDKNNVEEKGAIARTNVTHWRGKYWYAHWNTDRLYSWDKESNLLTEYNSGIGGIDSVYSIDDSLWITLHRSDKIWKWNEVDGAECIYQGDINDSFWTDQQHPYAEVFRFANCVLVTPGYGKKMLRYQNDRFETVYDCDEDEDLALMDWSLYAGHQIVDDQLWLLPSGSDKLLIFNDKMELVDKRRIILNNYNDRKRILQFAKESIGIIGETELFSFRLFLDMVKT